MAARDLVDPAELADRVSEMRDDLLRSPAIDRGTFLTRARAFIDALPQRSGPGGDAGR